MWTAQLTHRRTRLSNETSSAWATARQTGHRTQADVLPVGTLLRLVAGCVVYMLCGDELGLGYSAAEHRDVLVLGLARESGGEPGTRLVANVAEGTIGSATVLRRNVGLWSTATAASGAAGVVRVS